MKNIIKELTVDEKISLVCGDSFWSTTAIERLNIPALFLSDGPHGLRKQEGESDHLGINESSSAVCFPAGCATGASFNTELLENLGNVLGQFSKQENIDILLGPAMNIKRSPLCGRNFEYFSEDPCVTGALASAYVKGLQSNGVGASPKHFAVNNQEYRRMTSSSNLDNRTLREIYLNGFEQVVKEARPMTIMSAYNRVNGVYASDSRELLTSILRDEWGFDGIVVSDWGASNDRATNLKAGLDLSMPNSRYLETQLREAIQRDEEYESALDEACERILNIASKIKESKPNKQNISLEEGHQYAKLFADESIVLLKNESVLPLNLNCCVAFIGPFAKQPRYQGGGSSHINSYRVSGALSAVPDEAKQFYAEGYRLDDAGNHRELRDEAVLLASQVDVVVVFAGLPDSYESEGYDRKHLCLPKQQTDLISELSRTKSKVVVVLHNGAPLEMPWINEVDAVLEAYLGGEAVGEATADILFGKINPSGRLAETFPKRLEDTPTYLTYGKEKDQVNYGEGIFVGYRYYNSKEIPVLFPFGHGLSYTTFEYTNMEISNPTSDALDFVNVSVSVTNTGLIKGKEVIQLYVSQKNPTIVRPLRELKAFTKIELDPGETKTVKFTLSDRAFSFWSVESNDWFLESDEYQIQFGKSVEDIIIQDTIMIKANKKAKTVYTVDSVLADVFENEDVAKIFSKLLPVAEGTQNVPTDNAAISSEMFLATMNSMPIRALMNYIPNINEAELLSTIDLMNTVESEK